MQPRETGSASEAAEGSAGLCRVPEQELGLRALLRDHCPDVFQSRFTGTLFSICEREKTPWRTGAHVSYCDAQVDWYLVCKIL